MSWLKIDDGFAEHPKVGDLTDRSFRLHVAALCYSARNLTDGHLSAKAVKVLAAVINASRVRGNLDELVNAKLWVDNKDGSYMLHGYLEHNPTADEVKKRRDERREAGRKGAEARWGNPQATAMADAVATAMGPAYTPDPDPPHKDQKPSVRDTIEAEFHALRLYREVRPAFQSEALKRSIVAFAHKLPPAEFQAIIDSLVKNRRRVKDEARYVMSALDKRLAERRAA